MRILLLGKSGQVGWELQRSLAVLGDVTALSRASTEYCGDLSNLSGLVATVRALRPDLIVNAAAYTAVDKAESDVQQAQLINADAPGVLAEEAARLGAPLVHYSTDYVFNGSGATPWRETDETGPLSVYGRTKLEGEQRIQQAGGRHLIFRTSWVYAARGGNFAKTMLRLARERERLTVIDDQFGAPTGADLLADVTAQAISQALKRAEINGVFHLAASGETNWHAYAKYVIDYAKSARNALDFAVKEVAAIPSSAFPLPAPRPFNSRLDTTKLRTTFGLNLPQWQQGVARMLDEILGEPS
ncbi:dTDP-4-dehydrorhamnose reductase [Variovorax sp. HJSM1_2]|uniref:dTDP-4-dehydrorhamnose reductase n=1 Tax=Variovorax sp. HJSM1_2 TaxID=3366263 RepID=UPI003BE576D2